MMVKSLRFLVRITILLVGLCSKKNIVSSTSHGGFCDQRSILNGTWKVRTPEPFAKCQPINNCSLTSFGDIEKDAFKKRWELCTYERCYFRKDESSLARTMEAMRWEWVPSNCTLQLPRNYTLELPQIFNAHQRRVHFRGDSLQCDWGEVVQAMAPSLNMTNLRLDRLGLEQLVENPDQNETQIMEGIADTWRKSLDPKSLHLNDIIIINAGAHWTKSPDDIYHYFKMIAQVMIQLYNHSKPLIVFRTTVMGHNDCGYYFSPVNNSIDTQKVFATKYQWANFKAFNNGIIRAFKEILSTFPYKNNGVRLKVLDVSMFEQRPDGHAGRTSYSNDDCLHYALPAIVYDWTMLLYHLIMSREESYHTHKHVNID